MFKNIVYLCAYMECSHIGMHVNAANYQLLIKKKRKFLSNEFISLRKADENE